MELYELKQLLDGASFLRLDEQRLYRVYQITKKSGGFRMICDPCAKLKALQKQLIPFFKRFPVSRYAAAYEKGCSVKNNALRHKAAKHALHTDIKEFFPSVSGAIFQKTFCKGLESRYADLLWRAVSYQKGIPIGAPCSPFIANRILYRADKKLSRIGLFIQYSRYADDLVFSARKPLPEKLIEKVKKIIAEAGFSLNLRKTYFMSSRKQITGIIIHDKGLSVGTGYKKRLKKEIYDYLVKNKGYPDIIRGKFSYLKDIEPDYAKILCKKYKQFDKKKILR